MVTSRLARTTLGLIALLCIGLAGSATLAAFTSDPVTAETEIAVGTLALTAVGDDLVFDSAPLAPGDSSAAKVRLRQSGTLAATVVLHRESTAGTSPNGCAIADALGLLIVEDRDGDVATAGDRRDVYDGTLAAAPTDLPLGQFAADERRTYEFTLTYAPQGGATTADNDNCFQGSVARQRFSWTAREVGA